MQELLIERQKYILSVEEISNCPNCNELLIEEKSVIKIYAKSDVDEGFFVSNMSGSHFCPNCPVVVFEKEIVEHAITLNLRVKKKFRYSIMGFVDLEAVPEEKRHLRLGTKENPHPLVGFLPDEDGVTLIAPQTVKKIGKYNDLKIGRNKECPCGSGRKYKKCCM